MKKIFLMFVVGMFFLSFASAEIQSLGIREQNKDLNAIMTCPDCTFNNITYITDPDSNLIRLNKQMDKDGTFYNYTILAGNFTILGEYFISGVGDLGGKNVIWNYPVIITPNGLILEEGEAILYGLSLFGVLFLFLLCLYFNITIEWKNHRNAEGKLISINDLKYLKLSLLPITYALFVWLLNILLGLSDFLQLEISSGFFELMFLIVSGIVWPLLVLWIIIYVVVFTRDRNTLRKLKEGLENYG